MVSLAVVDQAQVVVAVLVQKGARPRRRRCGRAGCARPRGPRSTACGARAARGSARAAGRARPRRRCARGRPARPASAAHRRPRSRRPPRRCSRRDRGCARRRARTVRGRPDIAHTRTPARWQASSARTPSSVKPPSPSRVTAPAAPSRVPSRSTYRQRTPALWRASADDEGAPAQQPAVSVLAAMPVAGPQQPPVAARARGDGAWPR